MGAGSLIERVPIMNGFLIAATGLSLVFVTACGGMTALSPTAPSATPSGTAPAAGVPAPPAPTAATPLPQVITGSVGPLRDGTPPCFADRYPCEVYDFVLERDGPIEVTLTWEGTTRAMMVQLYWAGEGLAHEDVAPRSGPSRISFLRPRMEAANYRIRVVSLEPASTIPFTLTLKY